MEQKELELYIHIPFCVRKCLYCDFVSFAGKEALYDDYIAALCAEIEMVSDTYRDRRISSVYIGGGTPSVLSPEQITMLVKSLRQHFHIRDIFEKRKGFHFQKKIRPATEVSIECNPGTVDREKLRTYRKLGINRLSIGLQSTDDRDLKTLGRIHSYDDFESAFEEARSAGFDNINIDLMQAIPGQNLNAWKRVMAAALMWKPEHISAYSLIIEDGTPFKQLEEEGKLSLPDEDEEREIYHYTKEFLEKSGYHKYEISNYSLPGFECRHNIGYWKRADYLGLGLNASSMIDNIRWKNTADLNRYMDAFLNETVRQPSGNNTEPAVKKEMVREEYCKLSHKEQIEEFVFLGLRMTEGISRKLFIDTFHQDFDLIFGMKVRKFADMGFILTSGDNVRLTDAGIDVSNQVLAQLLPD